MADSSQAPATQDGKMQLTITHSKAAAPDVKVAVKKVSQFRKVFVAAAQRFGTTPDALTFKYNGVLLDAEHTPKMHEIPDGGVITAYPAGEEDENMNTQDDTGVDEVPDFTASAADASSTPASKSDKVTLTIRSQEGPSFQIKVPRTKPLKGAFEQAHQQFRKAPGTFRFVYNGERLRAEDTPKMHEMVDDDEIDAQLEQVGGA
ncbi:ubiquitin-like Rad60 SUMO-like protein [Ceratobasidium sp. AG-Ba]|nr:ubiquitin-like Rad60 SUMO-like protein [Ceratobasidium sp. AG-Ba]